MGLGVDVLFGPFRSLGEEIEIAFGSEVVEVVLFGVHGFSFVSLRHRFVDVFVLDQLYRTAGGNQAENLKIFNGLTSANGQPLAGPRVRLAIFF